MLSFEIESVVLWGFKTGDRQTTVVLLIKLPSTNSIPFLSVENRQAIKPELLMSKPLPLTMKSVPHKQPTAGETEVNSEIGRAHV